jgi:hypothetical protein
MPVASMGTIFKKGAVTIAELTSIDGVSISADTIETTDLSSPNNYRTFLPSLKDGGEVSLSGHYNYTAHNPLLADLDTGAVGTFTIEFPDRLTTTGSKWTFSGVITAFSTSVELEDLISMECTIKISGKPTLSAPV